MTNVTRDCEVMVACTRERRQSPKQEITPSEGKKLHLFYSLVLKDGIVLYGVLDLLCAILKNEGRLDNLGISRLSET